MSGVALESVAKQRQIRLRNTALLESVAAIWTIATMQDVRKQLEAVLMQRIEAAMATLPDNGAAATPERAALVNQLAAEFVDDAKAVADEELANASQVSLRRIRAVRP